ncbi:unnamed protein product [Prorocentrum cordatum]|uniref:Uncharacterized protein n=1 Tax=Prorocentrum cordatum TaxID=2364126 RepID=A0ABN9WMR2_9DINO|nr:unnamed protein product [Polarella glacialis]
MSCGRFAWGVGSCRDDAHHLLQRDLADFNVSLLIFLPKAAADRNEEGVESFAPGGVRPLNITNTDNCLISSAVWIAIEPSVERRITGCQRGFLPWRSAAFDRARAFSCFVAISGGQRGFSISSAACAGTTSAR